MLFNLKTGSWDEELCKLFDIPMSMLPEVVDSRGFGHTHPDVLGAAIPIRGIAGDQQAALYGHDAIEEGMLKNTYGTGCFMLMNTGEKILDPSSGILATVAWRIHGKITYAAEGSVFNAGSAMTWLEGCQLNRTCKGNSTKCRGYPSQSTADFCPRFYGLRCSLLGFNGSRASYRFRKIRLNRPLRVLYLSPLLIKIKIYCLL